MTELRLLDDEGTLTVAEVGRRVERAIRRELPATIWVRGEIHDLKRPPTGHVHLSLVGEGCSLPVVLFASDRPRVNRMLKAAGNGAVRMTDGTEVRIRCEVRFFAPKGQISLRMLAIDPAFTLGRLAERREVLLQALSAEGLLRAQARLSMPALPLRIGLVTSVGSAAHADVLETLAASGLGWRVVECHASVQGPDAVPSLVGGLRSVAASGVDVVCLVRGGGARTDLAAFDDEAVARAVATLRVPVLTGIGHEVDTSVADEVAWQRHVTPTACAQWLVERARRWCERRDDVFARCIELSTTATERAGRRLDRRAGRIAASARHHVRGAGRRVDALADRARQRPPVALARAAAALDHRAARVAAADPARLLARGWSITRTADGRLVRSVTDAPPGSIVESTVADGTVRARVEGSP
jgi:exodeoxyribonuclease VII large subunit